MTRDKRDAEKRIDRLREARMADELKRDDGDGPGELTEKEQAHIDAILGEAWEENPEALADAERQLEREQEQEQEQETPDGETADYVPFNAAEKSREHGDGLSDGERALFDALGGGYEPETNDEPDSEGSEGPIIRLGSDQGGDGSGDGDSREEWR